jgi:CheY-like chemotaxis protein
VLRSFGHEVLVEYRAESAIPVAGATGPQICLLDIGLPGMNGIELAGHLRAQPETEHSILVALTGYGQEVDRAAALEAGFDAYLVKPVEVAALREVLALPGRSPAPELPAG